MIKRFLTICATVAISGGATSIALAQSYPGAAPGYSDSSGYPRGGYPADSRPVARPGDLPDFDAIDDEDDGIGRRPATALSPPGPIMSPDDPRYGRPTGPPVYSDRAAPQGPVMSPDDPRYGRPMGAPVYSDRPAAAPQQGYADRDDGRGVRPPEAVGGYPGGNPGGYANGNPGAQQSRDGRPVVLSALPPEEQPEAEDSQNQLPPNLRKQEVNFATKEPAGTIVVDTSNTYLYLVLGNGRAMRYGVRVGRDGFTWNGNQKITRKAEWPDWHPPSEMIERQPYLPRFMAGGPGNPMGARALYLGSTIYRIHGTNQPSTIGKFVSSGCIGMLNDDVADLFERVKVGTRVVVLPGGAPKNATTTASAQPVPGPNSPASVPGTQPTTVQPLPAPVTIR